MADWVKRGYQILSVEIADASGEGLPCDRAREELLAHGKFLDEPSDTEYAVDHLLNSRWLYEADGSLRITDPELERNELSRETI
ncbi:hypothetical protein [Halorubrum sp. BOL3-1]|uniref:hypothetical protein n=1 Tax=Halorubrum sp. BOL3-1 TaxID=2497325 RepID=UPI001F4F8578|nr:hypothetical protein [Halorubrum sp. BOL3-1]